MCFRGIPMLWIQSGNIEKGRMKDFQTFVKKNDDLFQKFGPAGWAYRGTYAYVLGFGRYGVAQMWECKTYGDFDTLREHDDPNWNRLFEEYMDFFDPNAGEGVLLRAMGDTKVLEPPKAPKKR